MKFPGLKRTSSKRPTLLSPTSDPIVPEKPYYTTSSTPRCPPKGPEYTAIPTISHRKSITPRPTSRFSNFFPRIKRSSLHLTTQASTPHHPYLHVAPSLASSSTSLPPILLADSYVSIAGTIPSRPPTPPPKDYDEIRELRGFKDRRNGRVKGEDQRRREGPLKENKVEDEKREGPGKGMEQKQDEMENYLINVYATAGNDGLEVDLR